MKKFLIASIAASMLATPMMATTADAAPMQRHGTTAVRHEPGRTVVTHRTTYRQPEYRRWNRGERFDARYAQRYQVINNWQAYRGRRLYAPPRGYHWVRSGNDAVLVAVTGGLIGAVLAGAFN
jgi:Ni/Co efflux regulator RcnB